MKENMTYKDSGVDYNTMDPFKKQAQDAAATTNKNAERLGYRVVPESRGESAFLLETTDSCISNYLSHVEEGLGTKSLVADEMYKLTGKTYYDNLAQDTVAMIVNDLITVGALPVSIAMHLAVGDSKWFDNKQRSNDLINGFAKACNHSGAVWSGGETPTLKGIIFPEASLLSGSATGVDYPGGSLISYKNIKHGDVIIFLESSGIHANGLTLARQIAEKLPDGYLTKLSDGRSYGSVLLDPTYIYVKALEACFEEKIPIHYAVNITGHGYRKLMRAPQNFSYVVENLPDPQEVFSFIQEKGNITDEEMYGNYNMGAGFALIVSPEDVNHTCHVINESGFPYFAYAAGRVEEHYEKTVLLKQKNLEFKAETLNLR